MQTKEDAKAKCFLFANNLEKKHTKKQILFILLLLLFQMLKMCKHAISSIANEMVGSHQKLYAGKQNAGSDHLHSIILHSLLLCFFFIHLFGSMGVSEYIYDPIKPTINKFHFIFRPFRR